MRLIKMYTVALTTLILTACGSEKNTTIIPEREPEPVASSIISIAALTNGYEYNAEWTKDSKASDYTLCLRHPETQECITQATSTNESVVFSYTEPETNNPLISTLIQDQVFYIQSSRQSGGVDGEAYSPLIEAFESDIEITGIEFNTGSYLLTWTSPTTHLNGVSYQLCAINLSEISPECGELDVVIDLNTVEVASAKIPEIETTSLYVTASHPLVKESKQTPLFSIQSLDTPTISTITKTNSDITIEWLETTRLTGVEYTICLFDFDSPDQCIELATITDESSITLDESLFPDINTDKIFIIARHGQAASVPSEAIVSTVLVAMEVSDIYYENKGWYIEWTKAHPTSEDITYQLCAYNTDIEVECDVFATVTNNYASITTESITNAFSDTFQITASHPEVSASVSSPEFMIPNAESIKAETFIKSLVNDESDQLGVSVRIVDTDELGTLMISGSPFEDSCSTGVNANALDNNCVDAGSANLYEIINDEWQQTAYLKASNTRAYANYGKAVAISQDGKVLAIGSPGESSGVVDDETDTTTPEAGAVYVYRKIGSSWQFSEYIKPEFPVAGGHFGQSVELNILGDRLLVGAPGHSAGAGRVFEFNYEEDLGTWSQINEIGPTISGNDDRFGTQMNADSDAMHIIVTAPNEDSNATGLDGDATNNSSLNSGAAYIMSNRLGTWVQEAYIKPNTTVSDGLISGAISKSANRYAVASGNAYTESVVSIYEFNPNNGNSTFLMDATAINGQVANYFGLGSNNIDANEYGSSAMAFTNNGDRLSIAISADESCQTGPRADESTAGCTNSSAIQTYFWDENINNYTPPLFIKLSNTSANGINVMEISNSEGRLVAGAPANSSGDIGINGNAWDTTSMDSGAIYSH